MDFCSPTSSSSSRTRPAAGFRPGIPRERGTSRTGGSLQSSVGSECPCRRRRAAGRADVPRGGGAVRGARSRALPRPVLRDRRACVAGALCGGARGRSPRESAGGRLRWRAWCPISTRSTRSWPTAKSTCPPASCSSRSTRPGRSPSSRARDSPRGDLGEIDLPRAWTALALEAVGIAQRALELGVEHASTREQFGKPIGVYQAVSHSLARATSRRSSRARSPTGPPGASRRAIPRRRSPQRRRRRTPARRRSMRASARSRCSAAPVSRGSTRCTATTGERRGSGSSGRRRPRTAPRSPQRSCPESSIKLSSLLVEVGAGLTGQLRAHGRGRPARARARARR